MRLRQTVCLLLFFLILPISVPAQVPGTAVETVPAPSLEIPAGAGPEFYRDLVSRLSDEQVRELLLKRLDAQANGDTAKAGPSGLGAFLAASARGVGDAVLQAVVRLPSLLTGQASAFATFVGQRGAGGTLSFLGLLLAAIAAGVAGAYVVRRLTGPWRRQVAAATGKESLKQTLAVLALRLGLDVSDLLSFLVVSIAVLQFTMGADDLPIARVFIFALIALPMSMAAMSRFLMAPSRPELRLVHTDDNTARFLHRHQILMVMLIGLLVFLLDFNPRHGLPIGELRLGFWLNLAILVYLAVIVYRARDGLSLMLRGRDSELSPVEERVARAYPYVMIGLCAVTWLVIEVLVSQKMFHLVAFGQPYWTLLLIGMSPALDTMVRGLVRHLAPPMKGEGQIAEEAHEASKRSYIRIGRVVVFALVILTIAKIWQIDFHNLAGAGFGARAAAALIEVMIILGVGFLIFELVTLKINRKLADEQTALGFDLNDDEPGGGEGGGAGGSRLSTVLPLVRWMLQSAIIVITVLLVLGNIGFDITPLLAGAGIVGLAIGFGAQKLVSDVVSGIFFLVDDAFRTGEYVEIDGTLGTVERISIRSLQLRHHRGPVHTIPFGEIPKITNYSRDWVIMKMRFTVPFDTDLNKVKKLFKQIGAEMMEVPEYAEDLMQPFKSQGVLEVDDVGIVVRGKFMAKPGKQFTLRKEIYNRVQKAFDANGIEFARREVRVKLEGDERNSLTEEQQHTVAAAAADAVGAAQPPEPAKA